MGAVVLSDDQQAAGILVEPMHDAGAPLAADAGETRAAMGDQGVHQRATTVARRRMHHEPGGLVDHDHVAVLVNDMQRNFLPPRASPFRAAARAP